MKTFLGSLNTGCVHCPWPLRFQNTQVKLCVYKNVNSKYCSLKGETERGIDTAIQRDLTRCAWCIVYSLCDDDPNPFTVTTFKTKRKETVQAPPRLKQICVVGGVISIWMGGSIFAVRTSEKTRLFFVQNSQESLLWVFLWISPFMSATIA